MELVNTGGMSLFCMEGALLDQTGDSSALVETALHDGQPNAPRKPTSGA